MSNISNTLSPMNDEDQKSYESIIADTKAFCKRYSHQNSNPPKVHVKKTKTQNVKINLEIQQLKSENEQLKSENEELKTENVHLKIKVSNLTDELSKCLIELVNNDSTLQKKTSEMQSTISKLTNELQSSLQRLDEHILESQMKEVVLQQTISNLQHELQDKTTVLLSKERKVFKDFNKVEKDDTDSDDGSVYHDASPILPTELDVSKKVSTESIPKSSNVNVSSTTARKMSQFINYSLEKNKKYSTSSTVDGSVSSVSFLSFENNTAFILQAKAQLPKLTWKSVYKQKLTEKKTIKYSFWQLFNLAPKKIHMPKVNVLSSPLRP
uniref:M protein, serotype 5-like n=1 Tax=Erigeron canadensis TaxID=72917 RepID=UPI001CB9711D|nr:M protein, serotype 5-like [Erigeron canadensis]